MSDIKLRKTIFICLTIVCVFAMICGTLIYLNSVPYVIGFQTDDNSALIVKDLTDAVEKTDYTNKDLWINLTKCETELSYQKDICNCVLEEYPFTD